MLSRARLFCILLPVFCASIAQAQNAPANAKLLASKPNGCGSSWTIYLVPDSIPVAECTFRPACDQHDNCYGKCEGRAKDIRAPQCAYLRCRSGGDLFNSAQCKTDSNLKRLELEAKKRRGTCDIAIGTKIREINLGRPVCQAFGYVYEKAVKQFGDTFFQGLRPMASGPDQPKEEYDSAIREFFRHGTPAEFEQFNASPPSFDDPLKYEPGKGLINATQ